MSLITIDTKNVPFLFDKIGRVVIQDDKVFRIISDKNYIELYKELLTSNGVASIFSNGLIETKIHSEDLENSVLILEHKKIDFFLQPSEYTNNMFWEAAVMFIKLSKKLFIEHSLLTVDSHPWNITFDGTSPVFFDFTSLYKGEVVSHAWINEFETYFATPIWLASFSKKTFSLAIEYRREHARGFGVSLLRKRMLKKLINRKFKIIYKSRSNPIEVFDKILNWLEKHKPFKANPQYWSHYTQSPIGNIDSPKTIKQKFVYKVLTEKKPRTVLDLAANKGFYALMANKLGVSVMAFDYEEETVDACIERVKKAGLSVTSALMDFNQPTPESGIGLIFKNSFERLSSDIVFALGLIHHICLIQRIPVFLFCEICKKYARKGIILEFVDPTDIHVKSWKANIPKDYNVESIVEYMSNKFSKLEKSEVIDSERINRTILYFFN